MWLHQEVANNHLVSQWWGHCGLHQHEVPECRGMENPLKVCHSDMICQLTTVPRHPITQIKSKYHEDKKDYDSTSWLLKARPLTAFENDESMESDNQSSSITLISFPLNHPLVCSSVAFQDDGSPGESTSLPTHSSYALRHCIDTSPLRTL